MNMLWVICSAEAEDALGIIPSFLDAEDPRSAAEQFNERYAHGGGWNPEPPDFFELRGIDLVFAGHVGGDPDEILHALAFAALPLSGEMIVVYPFGFVLIAQPTGGRWEVARLD